MKFQPQSVAWANIACAARNTNAFTSCFLLLLMLGMVATYAPLQAQAFFEFDLSEYAYSVETPSALLMQGDTATFEVTLGETAAPANNVAGLRLIVATTEDGTIPADIGLSVYGSWCFATANLSTDLKVQSNSRSMNLLVYSTDNSSNSGAGLVFRFDIVATQNNVQSSDLIADLDGVVIVENIDCKMAPSQRQEALSELPQMTEQAEPTYTQAYAFPSLTPTHAQVSLPMPIQAHAYPNPTQDRVEVPLRMEAGQQAFLIAPDGQVHILTAQYCAAGSAFDLSNYPPGMYQLQICQAGKPLWQERILKR